MRQPSSTIIDFDWCLQGFLLLAPIIWLPSISQNGLQMLILNFLGPLLLALALFFGAKRVITNPVIPIILLVSIVVSLITAPRGYPVGMISLVSGLMLYYAILLGVKNPKKIIRILAVVALINILFAISFMVGFPLVYDNHDVINMSILGSHLSIVGLMGRSYHLAFFLIILAPLIFLLNRYAGYVAMGIASIFALIIESYACRLALIVTILVLVYRKVSLKVFLVIISILLAIGVYHHEKIMHKINLRLPVYNQLANESLVNIFFGSGIGSMEINKRLYDVDSTFESSFNQYLRIGYELGVVPLILILGSMWGYFKRFPQKDLYFLASLSAILIYPFFHEVLRFARLDILIITVVALFEIDCIDKLNNQGVTHG